MDTEVEFIEIDIGDEKWREYDFSDSVFGSRVYRIVHPAILIIRPGGTTHRVVDQKGIVHCVPAPGAFGCVLRWEVKPGAPLVKN